MKKSLNQQVSDWLFERRQVVDRYKSELHASYFDHNHKWGIDRGDGTYRDLDLSNPSEVGLLVNHAYYLGCLDGVSWYRR